MKAIAQIVKEIEIDIPEPNWVEDETGDYEEIVNSDEILQSFHKQIHLLPNEQCTLLYTEEDRILGDDGFIMDIKLKDK